MTIIKENFDIKILHHNNDKISRVMKITKLSFHNFGVGVKVI
jgi:hypothetical protein